MSAIFLTRSYDLALLLILPVFSSARAQRDDTTLGIMFVFGSLRARHSLTGPTCPFAREPSETFTYTLRPYQKVRSRRVCRSIVKRKLTIRCHSLSSKLSSAFASLFISSIPLIEPLVLAQVDVGHRAWRQVWPRDVAAPSVRPSSVLH